MKVLRVFVDTAYIQALLNRRDDYHDQARRIFPQVTKAKEVWTTEAVLIEVGDALSRIDRSAAVNFIDSCYGLPNMHIVTVDTPLLKRALDLYRNRRDKTWGLTDCISFVVMHEHGLSDAVATDEHFRQAGFNPLMKETAD